MEITLIISIAVVLCNAATFFLYAADKKKAEGNQFRISEASLIGCAFMMGGLGAFLAMHILRHKTKHLKFKVLVPVAMLCNAAMIGLLFFLGVLSL